MFPEILAKLRLRDPGKAPRDAFKEKFSESGWRVFQHAFEESRRHEQFYLSLAHLLDALAAEDPASFDALIHRSGVTPEKAREFIREAIESYPRKVRRGTRIAPEVIDLMWKAQEVARSGGSKIGAADFFEVLARGVVEFPRVVVWKVGKA